MDWLLKYKELEGTKYEVSTTKFGNLYEKETLSLAKGLLLNLLSLEVDFLSNL